MTETLYMIEMEQLLEEVERLACSGAGDEELQALKDRTTKRLVRRFGLEMDDAQDQVAAAAGEM